MRSIAPCGSRGSARRSTSAIPASGTSVALQPAAMITLRAMRREVVSSRRTATAGTVALTGVGAFVAALAALHVLRSEYDPVTRLVSEYAIGPYGGLLTAGIVALAVGGTALIAGLHWGLAPAARSSAALGLLGLALAGLVVAAVFPTDVSVEGRFTTTITTTSGRIHGVASAVAYLSLIGAALLLTRSFAADPRWRGFHPTARLLALALPLGLGGSVLGAATSVMGVPQRLFLGLVVLWLVLTARQLRRVASVEAPATLPGS